MTDRTQRLPRVSAGGRSLSELSSPHRRQSGSSPGGIRRSEPEREDWTHHR